MSTVEVPMQQAASSAPVIDAARGARGADRAFRVILTVFGLTVLAVPTLMVLQLVQSSRLAIDKFGLGSSPAPRGTLRASSSARCRSSTARSSPRSSPS